MRVLRLGDVCTKIGSGATPRGGSSVYLSHGTALIRSQNVYNDGFQFGGLAFIGDNHADELANVEVEAGDVLLNITGDSVARSCRAPDVVLPARVNQHVAIIRPDTTQLDTRYLHYHLISPSKQAAMLSLAGAGATRKALTKGMIEDFEVPAPSLEEQRTIANVLGALDDKLEQNRRTAQGLEKLARAIFRAWFVDFEPVRAKAEGATSFPSMPQTVFDALPTTFTDSEIGPVPDGWEVKPLSKCVQLTMGQSPPSEFYNKTGDGLPFHQGVTDYGFRFPSHRVYCTVESRIAESNDVLLSVRAPVGRINVANQKLVLGRGLAGLRHPEGRQSFLLYHLKHIFAEEDAIGDGTVYKAVTKRFLSQMPILSPSENVQAAFERVARPMDELIAANETESRKLAKMRDYLLPKLLSGAVRVEDAETVAEELSA